MPDETRWLKYAALLYALGLALHTADHVRRGLDVISTEVQVAGYLSTAVGIVTVALILAGNRHGPLLAAITGIPIAIGVAAVHLLPHWSVLSDAFLGAHNTCVTGESWTVVTIEIVGALAMGLIGISLVRRRTPVAA
jgi:hypothetical protein